MAMRAWFRQIPRAAGVLTAFLIGLAPAAAQQRPQGEPGKFDFYVLSLSWSPSYCDSVQERASARRSDARPDQQCDGGRPYAFVVHGLWPQYERGFPSWCQVPAPRIPRTLVDSMLDLMPSPQLVFHEWDRHGTCSGLSAQNFFAAVRQARSAINIPEAYAKLDRPITVTPGEVTENFLKANPQLSRDEIAVSCDRKRLTEVRICMSKDFAWRKCPDVIEKACKIDKVLMPAVRGGKQAQNAI
jgi:ribonuclease T2